LGIGLDGHTASLFNMMEIEKCDKNKFVMQSIHPDSKQERITLTSNFILNSKVIIFYVVGKEKQKIIHLLLNKNIKCMFPAKYIYNNHSNCYLFTEG